MTAKQFCPYCGHQREKDAAFCVSCGESFEKQSNWFSPNVFIMGIFLFSFLGFIGFLVSFVELPIKRQAQLPSNHPTTANTAAGADHVHEDPPFIKDLKSRAATNDPEAQITLAEAYIQLSGQDAHFLADAATPLKNLLAAYPDHAYALRMLGNVHYQLEQPGQAVTMYERYLALHPQDANVRTDMATQLMLLERYDEAITQYKEALNIFPNLYTAYFNMSIAYARMNRDDDAKQARTQAEAVAEQHGKQAAPIVRVPRLPEGIEAKIEPPSQRASDFGMFGPLAKFFTEHQIVGPKMTDFIVSGEKATLVVRNFPMEAMPPFVRQTFDEKVRKHLEDAGGDALLEIRDADNQKLLASYPGN